MRNKRSDVIKRLFSVIALLLVLMPLFFTPVMAAPSYNREIKGTPQYSVMITGQQTVNIGDFCRISLRLIHNGVPDVGRAIRLTPSEGSMERGVEETDENGIARFTYRAAGLNESVLPLDVSFRPGIFMGVNPQDNSKLWRELESDFHVTVYPKDKEVLSTSTTGDFHPSVCYKEIAETGIHFRVGVQNGSGRYVEDAVITFKLMDESGKTVFWGANTTDVSGDSNLIIKYPAAPPTGNFTVEIQASKDGYQEGILTLPLIVSPRCMDVQISFLPRKLMTGKTAAVIVTVTDRETGEPVSGAVVRFSCYDEENSLGPNRSITDDSGRGVTHIDVGNHVWELYVSVTVTAVGYATAYESDYSSVTYYDPEAAGSSSVCLTTCLLTYILIIGIGLMMFRWGMRTQR